jgi:hypothetical protein
MLDDRLQPVATIACPLAVAGACCSEQCPRCPQADTWPAFVRLKWLIWKSK